MYTQNEEVAETTTKKENAGIVKTIQTGVTTSVKIGIIAVLSILLFIPMSMIKSLIEERKATSDETIEKVTGQWCAAQNIVGPTLNAVRIVSTTKTDEDGTEKSVNKEINIKVLPKKLNIKGEIKNETRKKGLYKISLFTAPIEMNGCFELSEDMKASIDNLKQVTIEFALTDLKGISDEMKICIDGKELELKPSGNGMLNETSQLSAKLNLNEVKDPNNIPFSMKFNIKGSQSLKFAPIGEVTNVHLTSNATTPSFVGNFLPESSEITGKGFSSNWKISYLNRNYPQEFVYSEFKDVKPIDKSMFGVDLLIPVQHYQQSLRCTKYAMLFIMLTFAVFFFVEHIQQKHIHPIQYLLVGLALTLFYSLLISLSEHIGFTPAYAVASAMTISMLTIYTAAVLHIKKTACYIGGILAILYVYIFVLIQMETYALVAGSLGLFCILAGIMYLSQKVDWNKNK